MTTTTETITEFLTRMLDEDEAAARAASEGPWWVPDASTSWETTVRSPDWTNRRGWRRVGQVAEAENAAHIARHDPARVLADVAAKRAVLDYFEHGDDVVLYRVIQLLAAPFADHPDYDERWAVS